MLGRRIQCIVFAHHRLRVPLGHIGQVGQTGTVLTGIAAAQRAWSRDLSAGSGGRILEGCQNGLDGLGGQVFVIVIVDLDHWGVDASSQALDFDECKETVFGGVAGGDSKVLSDSLDDRGTTAATELAGSLKCRELGLSEMARGKFLTVVQI